MVIAHREYDDEFYRQIKWLYDSDHSFGDDYACEAFNRHADIVDMALGNDGLVYIRVNIGRCLCEIRVFDGVKIAYLRFNLIDKKLIGGEWVSTVVRSREDALDLLYNSPIQKDNEFKDWFISEMEYRPAVFYVWSKVLAVSCIGQGGDMMDYVMSMAKMASRFGKGELRMDYGNESRKDRDQMPHVHYRCQGSTDVVIDIQNSCILRGKFTDDRKEEVMKYIEDNITYFRCIWDELRNAMLFLHEYVNVKGAREKYIAMFNELNPIVPLEVKN